MAKKQTAPEIENTVTKDGRGAIVMLPIEKLHPHPNNPRKDLGDLTELTASIAKNGVLQNLTVVSREDGDYTIIIGHRRTAASKRAGLTELPCVIAELTEQEQLGMMLSENMQRADITPAEQAETMQMMLDLGETVEGIAERTGFTKKTVKDRLKLSKLDRQKLKKACDRQVTLTDLIKISEIKDEKARDELLSKAGTKNFNDAYQRAKDQETTDEKMNFIQKELDKFAVKRDPDRDKDQVYRMTISSRRIVEHLKEEIDKAREEYGGTAVSYRRDSWCFALYSARTAAEEEKAAENAKKREQSDKVDGIYDRLKEIAVRHYNLRLSFVREKRLCTSAYSDVLLQEYLTRRIENTYGDTTYIRKALGAGRSDNEATEMIKKYKGRPEDLLFLMAYSEMRDTSDGFFAKPWRDGEYHIEPKTNESLRAIYDFLCKYGYEMSDDEIDCREGRHEVYREYLALVSERGEA